MIKVTIMKKGEASEEIYFQVPLMVAVTESVCLNGVPEERCRVHMS